jgi:60 kDa SS-A/Ro ribonucleoprotein
MKFNFSLKRRQSAGARYTFVKGMDANVKGMDANVKGMDVNVKGMDAKGRMGTELKAGMPDAQWELYTSLLSAALSSNADGPGDVLAAVREGIRSNDLEFVTSLSLYVRERKNIGHLAFLLTAEFAALPGNDEKAAPLIGRVLRHVTEIPAWLGYFDVAAAGQKPGKAIRKTLSGLLNQLEDYSFSRYTREMQEGIRQALLVVRPRAASRDQKALFSRIERNQVVLRPTWEQEWHALHQQHYDSPEQRQVILRDKWKEGISSFRIGYTALLENLQPMLCTGVSGKVLKLAAEYLGNTAAVTRAGHSPLKMLEVYRGLRRKEQGGAGMLSEALELAVLNSTWSQSDFGRNVVSVIAMDVSNSMKRPVGAGADVLRFDVAPLLAMLWKSRGDQVITGFVGNTWKPVELSNRPVLSATDELRQREGEAGYAINAHLVIQDLLRKQQVVDKVLIFTDTRLWDNRTFNQAAGTNLGDWWRLYRNQMAPKAKLYLFDLAGYGAKRLEMPEESVFLVAGWQENIWDVLTTLEIGYRSREN